MEIRIKELCEAKEIKSAYRLAQAANLTMPTAYRAFANDIKQFTPETLERLCIALECTPNDIFGYAPQAEIKKSRAMYSIGETAEKLGVSRPQISALIRDKKLSAEKNGRSWLIDEKDIALMLMHKNSRLKKVRE